MASNSETNRLDRVLGGDNYRRNQRQLRRDRRRRAGRKRDTYCFCCQKKEGEESDCGVLVIIIGLTLFSVGYYFSRDHPHEATPVNHTPWTYICRKGGTGEKSQCDRSLAPEGSSRQGLNKCKMICNPLGTLWPSPTGHVVLSSHFVHILPRDVSLLVRPASASPAKELAEQWKPILKEYLYRTHPLYKFDDQNPFAAHSTPFVVTVSVFIRSGNVNLTAETDESYELVVTNNKTFRGGKIFNVDISANTFFGARHGLETFSQLLSFDEITECLQMHTKVYVSDRPAYAHRGILLDTSHSFISPGSLRQTIDAMSYNKLNVLHLKLNGWASFPYESEAWPNLARFGAFSHMETYTADDFSELVEYARLRGVRLLPEWEAPAQAGRGWETWPEIVACSKVQAACGQLLPLNEKVYEVLGKIYSELWLAFSSHSFHIGGREIDLSCWSQSEAVINAFINSNRSRIGSRRRRFHTPSEQYLLLLWKDFHQHVEDLLFRANHNQTVPSIVMWYNSLVDEDLISPEPDSAVASRIQHLSMDTNKLSSVLPKVVDRGYHAIFSPKDAWHFDHTSHADERQCANNQTHVDASGRVNDSADWKDVYNFSPRAKYRASAKATKMGERLLLGGEGVLWDGGAGRGEGEGALLQAKLWPKAAALAERLWADSTERDWRQVESRLQFHRLRMTLRGIPADVIQSEFCYHNELRC